MKKITLALSLLTILGAASCKKDDDKKAVASGSGSWTIDGTTFNSISATANENAYAFGSSGAASTVGFYFTKYPTASGTYHFVNTVLPSKDDEVTLLTGTQSPLMVAMAMSGGDLNVTVSGGKVNMKCSGISISKENGTGTSLGTGTFSADVTY